MLRRPRIKKCNTDSSCPTQTSPPYRPGAEVGKFGPRGRLGSTPGLGPELRKISKFEIIVLLRIAIVTLEPESKVRNMRTATRGNGWRPRGGGSLAERRARPGSDGLTLSAGAQRRQNLRWSETTRMAPKASCHDLEPRERPRAPRPTGSDPDVRTNTQTRWLMSADTVRTDHFVWETP